MTTKTEIKQWLERGKEAGATHMLVVCDDFDYEDYPVYISKDENINNRTREYDGVNMQRIMEVYDLSLDFDSQLNEARAFHGWPK